MRWNVLNRRIHYWATAAVGIPVLIVISTGLLLQMKKQWGWVQPLERRGTGSEPAIDLRAILQTVERVPGLNVSGWNDVNRIDVRPSKGMAKVWLRNGWEVQVDLGTGQVLQTAYRRSDLLESIHDGSFFGGDAVKLAIFLPAGVLLLVMWISGIWMFVVPLAAKRRLRQRTS